MVLTERLKLREAMRYVRHQFIANAKVQIHWLSKAIIKEKLIENWGGGLKYIDKSILLMSTKLIYSIEDQASDKQTLGV